MKKVLTIGLMLLACAGFVFAAVNDNANLTVSLEVDKKSEVGWFISSDDVSTWSNKISSEQPISSAEGLTVYAAVKTNTGDSLKLTITGNPLSSEDTSDKIGLTATITDDSSTLKNDASSQNTATWASDSSGDSPSIVLVEKEYSKENNSGLRNLYAGIKFTYDADDYANAGASENYKADITLTVTAE